MYKATPVPVEIGVGVKIEKSLEYSRSTGPIGLDGFQSAKEGGLSFRNVVVLGDIILVCDKATDNT